MIKRTTICMILVALVMPAVTGCMPKMTIEQMKADMPQRPPELDKLDMFVGEWESTGEAEFAGLDRVLKTKSSGSAAWECDNWLLVERGECEMEELGKMQGIGIWMYDTKSKKYRNWWFSSLGEAGTSTATYDDSTKTWKFKGKSRSGWGTSITRGTATMLDGDTMEWTWTERCRLGLFKILEMKGTSRRK